MRFKRFFAILFLAGSLIVFFSCSLYAQRVSNEGRNFWIAFPTHSPSNNGLAEMVLYITSRSDSRVTVRVGNNTPQTYPIKANTVSPIPVNRNQAYITGAGYYAGRGINVVVEDGQPAVVVYAHMYANARSAASLILPVEALGQKYYSMNYDQIPGSQDGVPRLSQFVIIASEANTKILIHPRLRNIPSPGPPQEVTLVNAGDVYEYTSNDDLTGTFVEVDPVTSACKRFAMFSGSSATGVGCSDSFDPLFQQAYPVKSWGKEYGFVPFSGPNQGNIIRVVASEDNTQVIIPGYSIPLLSKGQFFTTPPNNTRQIITSDKPIAVAQYALTAACADTRNFGKPQGSHPVVSDPDMVLLNPTEFNISDITVFSSKDEAIITQYINIFIKTTATGSFRVNGAVPLNASFLPIGNSGYSYMQLNVGIAPYNTVPPGGGQPSIRLSASEGFNAIAYGFGNYESYAYSAGTNLASSQSISAVRKVTREELSNACTQEDFDFKLVLQAEADTIFWKFDVNDPGIKQVTPQATPVLDNGKILYHYFYPRTYVFDSAGQKIIKITVDYKDKNICSSLKEQIDFLFEVYDPPTALFQGPSEICESDTAAFIDKSSAKFKAITKWHWDFGDGITSDVQNPSHKYSTAGEYTVRLAADNETACTPDFYEQKITVHARAVPGFSAGDAGCSNNTIAFTDASTGDIVKWKWDFGDQTTLEALDSQPVIHTYQSIGSYNVKLTLVNNSGCESIPLVKTVNVFSPTLSIGQDLTIIEGETVPLNVAATGNNLKFKWTPALGLSSDTIQNPNAGPLSDVMYTVTITTEEGCVLSDSLMIKVLNAIKTPNTFSPNGDGVNDVWNIENLSEYPGSIINIFNRYGEKLYSSVGYPNPWDGKYRGEDLPVGTYYYVIDPKNGRKPVSGSITILR